MFQNRRPTCRPSPMNPLLPVLFAALLNAAPPPGVLRVGSGQPYTTIGQALAAAAPGDLVLVEPGIYPAFVVTAPVTIAAAQTDFTVLQGTSAAAITVAGAAGTIAIDGARIAFVQTGAPAITITGCSGEVRLRNVQVDAAADLVGAAARAAIEVADCAAVVFDRVTVQGTAVRRGNTSNPDGANDGLCATRFADTHFVLRNCVLRGYDRAVGGSHGGDAVRVVATGTFGAPSCWLLSDNGQFLVGGAAIGSGGRGGNCLHLLGAGLLAELCGQHYLTPGSGGQLGGGYFAIQDDGGQVAPGVGRMIPACVLELVAVTAAPATVATGGQLPITVSDFTGGMFCAAFLSLGGSHRPTVPGAMGRVLLDLTNAVTLGVGVTPAAFAVAIPAHPGLAGLQLTAQAAVFGAPPLPTTVTSWPTLVSVR